MEFLLTRFGRFPDEFLCRPAGVRAATMALFLDWSRRRREE